MDSYVENGRQWVACHECIFGGNGSLNNCSSGKNIVSNTINRGCCGGILISEFGKENAKNE